MLPGILTVKICCMGCNDCFLGTPCTTNLNGEQRVNRAWVGAVREVRQTIRSLSRLCD